MVHSRNAFLGLILIGIVPTAIFAQTLNDFPSDQMETDDLTSNSSKVLPRSDYVNFTVLAPITAIEDGDTVTLKGKAGNRFVIRFSDIDTPEISHPAFTPSNCKCNPLPFRPGQAGGKSAKQSMLDLVSIGDIVRAECYEMDQYGRAVCHVFKGATNINLEQIKRGWGWLPGKSQWVRDPESKVEEEKARVSKVGAWGLPNQVAPSEWRKACWSDGNCDGQEN